MKLVLILEIALLVAALFALRKALRRQLTLAEQLACEPPEAAQTRSPEC